MSLRRNAAFLPLISLVCLISLVWAEGTQLWRQSSAEEFEKGTSHGVAIRSDGTLELAPASKVIATTASTYVWSIASDAQGNAYLAAGSPARVYRVTPDGKTAIILQTRELEAQAIVADASGNVYVGTSPDGQIYKIANAATAAVGGGNGAAYFNPKTKYIWALAVDRAGSLYAGTGDGGEIYKVDASGRGGVFFKSDETHIRSLAFDAQGELIAGSDGSGLVYRIAPNGQAFVLFSAPKKEITSIAIDGAGNIYAASVGEKHSSAATEEAEAAPASPAKGEAEKTKPASPGNGGSEIDELAPDGSSRSVWSSREELVYAMAFDRTGRLLIGTGNRGRVYGLARDAAPGADENLLKVSASQVTGFAPSREGMFAATSNLGKLLEIAAKPAAEGSFESDVFDAKTVARWGRIEVHGRGRFEMSLRSGNVDNPDRNWSNWTKVDLKSDNPPDVPPSRFAQWRAVLHAGDMIEDVGVNYHPKNIAPVVDDVTVATTARGAGGATSAREIKVTWTAHDENDDELRYAVYFRGEGETRWMLLRDDIKEKQTTLDPTMFPDGAYQVRVVASDAPSHSPEDALTGERVSSSFEVDSTPPRIDTLQAVPENGTLHISFRASDSYAPIKRAEYSIDAGEWQLIEPVGGLSDARTESYDFNALLRAAPPDASAVAATTRQRRGKRKKQTDVAAAAQPLPQEHLVVIRVFDRFDNGATAKTIVNAAAQASQP